MRKNFETLFWQRAYESLPESIRGQHLSEMQSAERWELTLGTLIELGSRVKNSMVRLFASPRRAL